jgi:hypothetical protein
VTDSREKAVIGYLTGIAILSLFFWVTLGDAYGRFMIGLNPGKSMMSDELRFYTGRATGLVCLVAPFVLAYLPRYVIGQWVETGWEYAARAGLWMLANGKRLADIIWPYLSRAACTLWTVVAAKVRRLSRFFGR